MKGFQKHVDIFQRQDNLCQMLDSAFQRHDKDFQRQPKFFKVTPNLKDTRDRGKSKKKGSALISKRARELTGQAT